jgi:hypothetical protein
MPWQSFYKKRSMLGPKEATQKLAWLDIPKQVVGRYFPVKMKATRVHTSRPRGSSSGSTMFCSHRPPRHPNGGGDRRGTTTGIPKPYGERDVVGPGPGRTPYGRQPYPSTEPVPCVAPRRRKQGFVLGEHLVRAATDSPGAALTSSPASSLVADGDRYMYEHCPYSYIFRECTGTQAVTGLALGLWPPRVVHVTVAQRNTKALGSPARHASPPRCRGRPCASNPTCQKACSCRAPASLRHAASELTARVTAGIDLVVVRIPILPSSAPPVLPRSHLSWLDHKSLASAKPRLLSTDLTARSSFTAPRAGKEAKAKRQILPSRRPRSGRWRRSLSSLPKRGC